jgi:hypothetical protein
VKRSDANHHNSTVKNFRKSTAWALFAVSLILLATTIEDIGITWDEVYYFESSQLHIAWVEQVLTGFTHGDFSAGFGKEAIDRYWRHDLYHNPHPPLHRILSSITLYFFRPFMNELTAYRLAPVLCFSLLIAGLFWITSGFYGYTAGLFSALSLLLTPRLFGHAHIAATDIPLATLWFFSTYTFLKSMSSTKWTLAFGVTFGLALSTKFTALIIPLPLALWALAYRRRKALRNLLSAAVISSLVVLVLNPGWWYDTPQRIYEFIDASLSRADALPISTFYLGENYLYFLPWHHPLVMVAVTTPAIILLLSVVGAIRGIRCARKDSWAALCLLSVIIPMATFMLPPAPGHDGVRQFLLIFPFLAVFSGLGFTVLSEYLLVRVAKRIPPLTGAAATKSLYVILAILCLGPLALKLWSIHPYHLSYYNQLIGGLKGAQSLGMELTYWFDAMNTEFLEAAHEKIPQDAVIALWPPNRDYIKFLKDRGLMRKDLRLTEPKSMELSYELDAATNEAARTRIVARPQQFDFLILLFRLSTFSKLQWIITGNEKPVLSVKADDVPILALYDLR